MYAFTLGLQLDDNQTGFRETSYPTIGPGRLLQVLEQFLGLSLPPDDNDHLRLAAYRSALEEGLAETAHPFYETSFQADQIGAAAQLLRLRDELVEAGWEFQSEPGMPARLNVLASIEPLFQRALAEYQRPMPGRADRLQDIIRVLPERENPIDALQLLEPRPLWPIGWQRLFDQLEGQGTQFQQLEAAPGSAGSTDLGTFQQMAWGQPLEPGAMKLQADGSLLLLEGESDAELAPLLAALLAGNPDYCPALLVPEQQSQLETHLLLEGLPAIGLSKTSPSRPGQQALKLIPAFLWEPVNPFELLEYLNLSEKPLDADLSAELATALSRSPGLGSQEWNRRVARYFGRLQDQAGSGSSRGDLETIRRQYQLWFERRRFPEQEPASVEEVIPLLQNLHTWALRQMGQQDSSSTLAALAGQAQRMMELLQAYPRPDISRLELEQLIRAVYEGTPVVRHPAEAGANPVFPAAGAIPFAVDHLVWWSFIDRERDPFFSRWYRTERGYLKERGCRLILPEQEAQLALFQQKWPLTRVNRQLILVLPRQLAGTEVAPHPTYAMLKAAFGNLDPIRLNRNDLTAPPRAWRDHFRLPASRSVTCRSIPAPPIRIQLPTPNLLPLKQSESFTSLESLLYYPYQWLFRDQLDLIPSPMVSIPEENTLKGNLSHRIFERMLEHPDVLLWSRDQLFEQLRSIAEEVLRQEGSIFLLYGKEPDRIRFIQQVQAAAWTFVHTLRESGWTVAGVEESLDCRFDDLKLKGRLDIRLQRGDEQAIVDLKWGAKTYRTELIRNQADLQLVLYSKMASPDRWSDTAYFVIRSAAWLTRSPHMMQNVKPVTEADDPPRVQQSIWEAMNRTYVWRMAQIRRGEVEIRCAATLEQLEESYGEELMDLLELPAEDAPFDDYRTLIRQYA